MYEILHANKLQEILHPIKNRQGYETRFYFMV